MQIDQTEIHLQLSHIVRSVTRDHELFEDLLQEAYLHLWLKLLQTPGQTRSWYLQSCRFQLLHLLNAGSSMDAVKRRHARCEVEEEQDVLEREILRAGIVDSVFEQVSEKDDLHQLMIRLSPLQQQIFSFLHMGFGLRETARVMEISHQAVRNHRRNIADIAAEIDLFSHCGTLGPTPCENCEPSTVSG